MIEKNEETPRLPADKFMLLKHEIRVRGLYSDGMTVKQLLKELKRYRPECKVIIFIPSLTLCSIPPTKSLSFEEGFL